MKAFVAGATGQTGRRIVQELVKRNIPVRALVRNLEKGRETLPPEAELIVGDVLKPETIGGHRWLKPDMTVQQALGWIEDNIEKVRFQM